ncbi:MAG: Gfo/Idh/MocA family oxidoreductase [candidate division WOR-3 bacterium]|nr:MAG: Gfo/Idh/MocA family oxidoreductase [candidate division WOR-3 bacterium]
MTRVRFGILGCGKIGRRHAEHILRNRDAMLVGVYDIVPERAESFATTYKCRRFNSFEESLHAELDVVNVCTPSGLHASMSVDALMAGKNVLCEKPMTICLGDADQVVRAERTSGKRFFLVKQNRFNPPVKALKECVRSGRLGRILFMGCSVLWNRTREYYIEDDWRGTMALDGGALMTQCSHFLDLMLWIGGAVRAVDARMHNLAHPYIETEDTGMVSLEFSSGAQGVLQYTTATHKENFEGALTALGTTGTIKVGGQYLNLLEYWSVEGCETPVLETGAGPNDYGTYRGSMSNHDKVIDNVIRVLNGLEQIATNSAQGRESIEVMQAAYISAITARRVAIPLTGDDYTFRIGEHLPLSGRRKTK